MRKLIAYLVSVILAVSCVAELEQGGTAVNGPLEGAPVTITFSVPDVPIAPATKVLSGSAGDITEEPYLDPDMMYVIVCGGSQSIKYIRKAKLIKTEEDTTIPEEYYPFPEGDRKVSLYTFQVQLELSDQPRTIHFLGNVDENQLISGSYAYDNLPSLLSYNNKQAYWQELHVPHIEAKKDAEGNPIEDKDNGGYFPKDETASFFEYIPLIRNYAKIQVTNVSENFKLHSYAVIFPPRRGSVAPFRSNEADKKKGFDFNAKLSSNYLLSGYEKCSFEDLTQDINYLANMPAGVTLNDFVPPASEFEKPWTSEGRVLKYDPDDTESGFYIYERGVPTDKIAPTFIIVCGKFEDDDNLYYYRLDLMETSVENGQTVSKYYPIYRNFRYNIQLHRISSEGVESPQAAINSSSTDISADISMRHLADISNGTTRLVVEPFMTRTYSGPAEAGKFYELYVRFFNDVYSAEPDVSAVSVRVELEPMEDNSSDILILYDDNEHRVPSGGFFFPEPALVGGVRGLRTIRFNTVEPLDETKTQKIKIIGHNPGNPQDLRLYREVEITLQKKQPLTIKCTDPVPTTTGSSVTVDLAIPSELPESMFPLKFYIEPEGMTLTPDVSKDVNLPVVSGRSIATTEGAFKDTPAFQFIRTLTWEEYSNLSPVGGLCTFQCFFKTNRELSATTIWAYNEYFSKARASFENVWPLTLACTNPVLAEEGTPFRLEITTLSGLQESMFPLKFYIKPDAMTITPAESDPSTVIGPGTDRFTRTLTWEEYSTLLVNGEECTFYCDFTTTVAQSATTITVTSEHFLPGSVSFQNVKVVPTNHFWVEAIDDCTVKLKKSGLKYKKESDNDWKTYSSNTGITLTAGQKVSFMGGSESSKITWTDGDKGAFTATGGRFKVGGNLASLIVGHDYPTCGEKITNVRFLDFFKAQTGLIDAYELILPMTTLQSNAYKSMFDSCTNLVRGPQHLPATNLGETCYRNMFYGCSSLEYAPDLPATVLNKVKGAYQRIFWGCSKLNRIKMLGTTWRSDTFISDNTTWCAGVAAEGEIWLNASIKDAANWDTTWGTTIPAGWTVKFVGIDDVEP